MNNTPKQLAIIGATASGKSALAVKIAQKYNAIILSLDSLAIYKEIDIASAKPTIEERGGVEHYGIDVISPQDAFDVTLFVKLYRDALAQAQSQDKTLIIVGGTGFYLKSLISGISPLVTPDSTTKEKIAQAMRKSQEIYEMLEHRDPLYMQNIASNDTYRIEKALSILWSTGEIPSIYFKNNPPTPIITTPLAIYQIDTPKELLRERISKRSKKMLQDGLIDEVAYLEKKYTRKPNAMKAIGIKETLEYLDGKYDLKRLEERLSTNTARLAKRQNTFNRSQFDNLITDRVENLEQKIVID